ncbi:putative leader peptide [Streptomyces sp. CB02923]|uniref:putative leader peptide n=1 Tax=Streptomyces sp. CB02923 TaxID=1718985 RepID=UPI003FD4E8B1
MRTVVCLQPIPGAGEFTGGIHRPMGWWKGDPITTSRMPCRPAAAAWVNSRRGGKRTAGRGRTAELLRGGDVLMKKSGQLTQRRHVDLVRVSSALCRRSGR